MENDLVVLCFFAAGVFLVKLYVFRQEARDQKIIEKMENGEGPDIHYTFWGTKIESKSHFNKRVRKRMIELGLIRK